MHWNCNTLAAPSPLCVSASGEQDLCDGQQQQPQLLGLWLAVAHRVAHHHLQQRLHGGEGGDGGEGGRGGGERGEGERGRGREGGREIYTMEAYMYIGHPKSMH